MQKTALVPGGGTKPAIRTPPSVFWRHANTGSNLHFPSPVNLVNTYAPSACKGTVSGHGFCGLNGAENIAREMGGIPGQASSMVISITIYLPIQTQLQMLAPKFWLH